MPHPRRTLLPALTLLATLALPLAADDTPAPASPAAAAFARLQALAGTWQGKTGEDRAATLEVSVLAGGSVVMERFAMGDAAAADPARSMYTLYHLDGEHLMLTHYCVSNNQPRMRADLSAGDPDVLRFEFLDATNLPDPAAGHMHRAVIRFVDADHVVAEWTYRKDGADAYSVPVSWERVR